MTLLTDLIVRNEDRLLAQVLSLAEANGYFRLVPGTPEEWRAVLRGLSGSLLQAFRSDPSPPSLAADDIGREDGLSAFGVVEARKRRREGMSLGIFLGLVKCFRQAYLDLVRTAGLPGEEEERPFGTSSGSSTGTKSRSACRGPRRAYPCGSRTSRRRTTNSPVSRSRRDGQEGVGGDDRPRRRHALPCRSGPP